MRVTICPGFARGTVSAPPSKSMAHRALIAAALSEGESVISPIASSEDMLATVECLKELGAEFQWEGDRVTVRGVSLPRGPKRPLFCRESGSTLRFLIPLCLLSGEEAVLTGSERLLERPLSVYETLCKEKNLSFSSTREAVTLQGKLSSGIYRIPGNISSQFITGLLFALPLIEGDSVLEVEGTMESASYVDMTLFVMKKFGVCVTREGQTFRISGGQRYRAADYTVEGDYSNGAFLEAFSYLGGMVSVDNLSGNSLQADRVYRDLFSRLSQGFITADLSDCPDLAPILFVFASLFHGARFVGTARLRIKESDRGEAMKRELEKCGVHLQISENEILVPKGVLHPPVQPIDSHNDHRIVMAMSVLLSRLGGTVEGAEAVRKSFPDFFEQIKLLGIEVKIP